LTRPFEDNSAPTEVTAPPAIEYQRHDPAPGRPRVAVVIGICVLYGLLAVLMAALGLFLVGWLFMETPVGRGHALTVFALCMIVVCLGVAALLARWIRVYIHKLTT
jgi:hypothetical protein